MRKRLIAILMACLPLLLGTAIYIFLRPDTYISETIVAIFRINSALEVPSRGISTDFLRFYASDMLWAFALPPALFIVMCFDPEDLPRIFIISVLFALTLEILQYSGVITGTGDPIDFILESAAVTVAVYALKVIFGGESL